MRTDLLCWACSIHLACTANSNGLSGLESAGTSCSRCRVLAPGWTGHFLRVLLAHHKRSEHKKPGPSLFHVCPAHCRDPNVILKVRNQVLVTHPCDPSPVLQSSHHVLVRRCTNSFLCSAQGFFFGQKNSLSPSPFLLQTTKPQPAPVFSLMLLSPTVSLVAGTQVSWQPEQHVLVAYILTPWELD